MNRFYGTILAIVVMVYASMASATVVHAGGNGKAVNVRVSYSFHIPSSGDTIMDEIQVQEENRKAIYGIAERECEILTAVLAKTCKINQISVNVTYLKNNRLDGYQINAQVNYLITLKEQGEAGGN